VLLLTDVPGCVSVLDGQHVQLSLLLFCPIKKRKQALALGQLQVIVECKCVYGCAVCGQPLSENGVDSRCQIKSLDGSHQ
jgi:hypothetical protein